MSSIRTKMTLLVLLGGGIPVVAGGLVLARRIDGALQDEFDRGLVAKARSLATLIEVEPHSPVGFEIDFADEFMPEFEARSGAEYFQLWRADGGLVHRSDSLGGRDLPLAPLDGGREQVRDLDLVDGRAGRAVQVDFIPQDEDPEHGPGGAGVGDLARDFHGRFPETGLTLVFARGRGDLDATSARVRRQVVAAGALLLGGLVALLFAAIRTVLGPVDRLGRSLDEIDSARIDRRIAVPGSPTELAPLVEHVNALLDRVEAGFRRERRFSSDVAHELLSPVSKLRLMSEVARLRADLDERSRETLRDIDDCAQRIGGIVQDLLLVSRASREPCEPELETIGAGELSDEVCADVRAEARARDVRLGVRGADSLAVRSDRSKLRIVVRNLVDNAVHHGRPGGVVEIVWERGPGSVRLCVRNPADGLAAEDLEAMFDRFWRKDESRPSDGHVGLGLSVVQAVAEHLGLTVAARLDEDGLLEVELAGLEAVE